MRENISSALILEDDADWDIRIKSQMRDFALASRLLVQPLPNSTDKFLDPTYPHPEAPETPWSDFNISSQLTTPPTTSPYGDLDRWGMLWIGHCGCRFPWAEDENVPLGRAVKYNDSTVPIRGKINPEMGDYQLILQYDDFTRVTARSRVNTCTLGYGLSQNAAQRMLYEFGVRNITGTLDMMYRSLCDGVSGRDIMTCLSPQPALFNHHRPVGSKWTFTDISGSENPDAPLDQTWNEVPESVNIRWATRVNFPRLVVGRTDYIDSYPDE